MIHTNSSPVLASRAEYPVTNQQVRYNTVTDTKVLGSGSNFFQEYANKTLGNAAKMVVQKVVSLLHPYD